MCQVACFLQSSFDFLKKLHKLNPTNLIFFFFFFLNFRFTFVKINLSVCVLL